LKEGERELKLAETLIPKDASVKTALQMIEAQQRQALDNSKALPR
jgi:hypothetical protein